MNHLKSILQSLMFALALMIGGIGTAAAAGSIGSTDADATPDSAVSAVSQPGSNETFSGSDKDDDDKDDDDDSDW